jgi:2-polyprenyl-6-methoxyphenol hydroxylase-like FAD-dependent oxidoreductase
MPKSQPPESVELLVVGAGPVGLFAGLCAARQGLDVLVVDHVSRGYGRGHAALLHAEVLGLLDDADLVERLRSLGNPIESVTIHVDGDIAARVPLPAPVLAVPQNVLEDALTDALRARGVEVRAPMQVTTLRQEPTHVEVQLARRKLVTLGSPADYSEWESAEATSIRAGFVIGADGYDSRTRQAVGIENAQLGRTESFAMFEFPHAEAGREVHLCFESGLAGMMLPLAGQRVRWGFQLAERLDEAADLARLRGLLALRAPWFEDGTDRLDWGTVTQFERRLARRFGKGRVWLAGDAAHVTSPFGGHSMNVGLLEAQALVNCIEEASLTDGSSPLERYELERQREWHKLLGVNVSFHLLPHAPPWLAAHARRVVPALPASGKDLSEMLQQLGLQLS